MPRACRTHPVTASTTRRAHLTLQETATNNFIFNNTASNNGNNGIALYSSVVGPVTGNIIAANTVENNAGRSGPPPTAIKLLTTRHHPAS